MFFLIVHILVDFEILNVVNFEFCDIIFFFQTLENVYFQKRLKMCITTFKKLNSKTPPLTKDKSTFTTVISLKDLKRTTD